MVRLERDLPPELAGRAELSAAEYRALADTPPRRKYGAVPDFTALREQIGYAAWHLRLAGGVNAGTHIALASEAMRAALALVDAAEKPHQD
jgi:hypothetical protein